jgi:2-C-methyl-D-erythritol 4-phosphate cytidylyltransferase/2-C-methyl-D-erythritol 2,4-cyclodiphosphate synthase
MSDITLIILSAGNSTRFKSSVKKQWLRINNEPLWLFVANRFREMGIFNKIFIVASKQEKELMNFFVDENISILEGGDTRQNSLKNAINSNLITTKYVMVTDVARSCVSKSVINEIITHKNKADSIVPYLSVTDTVVLKNSTINRDEVKLIQTPQLSVTDKLIEVLNKTDVQFTDESTALAENGFSRFFVKGDTDGIKVTYLNDIKKLNCLKIKDSNFNSVFVGNGFDVHQFELDTQTDRKTVLGGVEIEDFNLRLKAHSDGDVLIHSVIDALLGGASIGDIGTMFPDSDSQYKNIDSRELLKLVVNKILEIGLEIIHIDITVIAQIPRLTNYKSKIQKSLSQVIGLKPHQINIKATTTEKLGFIGRKEGIGVISTATLKNFDWRDL